MGEKVEVGQIWTDSRSQFRVMAVAEGHAMCRRKGAIPFVVQVKEILRLCSPCGKRKPADIAGGLNT